MRTANADSIFEIVGQIEQQWNLPFLAASSMPPEEMWPGLLQAASFILLDWRLWPAGAAELERDGIQRHIRFLDQAKDYFVPVFIFTNDNAEDVTNQFAGNRVPGRVAGEELRVRSQQGRPPVWRCAGFQRDRTMGEGKRVGLCAEDLGPRLTRRQEGTVRIDVREKPGLAPGILEGIRRRRRETRAFPSRI